MAIAAILPTNMLTFIFSPTKGLDNIKIIVEIPLHSYYLSYMYITLKMESCVIKIWQFLVYRESPTIYLHLYTCTPPPFFFLIVLRVLIMPILLWIYMHFYWCISIVNIYNCMWLYVNRWQIEKRYQICHINI